MSKRKSEDELESEESEEDDDDVVEFSGDEEDDDDDGDEESGESGEDDDEDEDDDDGDDEGDEDDDEEEGSGSELDEEEDDSLEEGISGSDIDDVIQDDEFKGVSGSDVSDGEPEGSDDPEDTKEKGEDRDKEDEEKGGVGSAFSRAFTSIMKKKVPKSELTDSLGPVLAERKQLLVKKLEEEESERRKKSDIKKKKREERERGHTIPQTYTDPKEKALIKLATTGVVRLFNAVSKAQKVQAGADISSSKAAKATWKQSKQAFMSHLRGGPKDEKRPVGGPEKIEKEEEAGWAALRDDFMLGSTKMKDWDKNPEDVAV